jgi:hypothetical protein
MTFEYAAAGGSFVARSTGAINGCVPNTGGALRVVKVGGRCPRGTVALTFDAQGRAGESGPQGRTGPAGARGAQGL